MFPRGIGALAAGAGDWLGAFFSGWPRIGEFILLFIGYEPVALVFGAAGLYLLWKGARSAEDRLWGMFAAVAAVWVLIRPAAFPDEALWVILPLLVLGARALCAALESPVFAERPQYVLLQAGAILALAAFAVFNLATATSVSTGSVLYILLAMVGFLADSSRGCCIPTICGRRFARRGPGWRWPGSSSWPSPRPARAGTPPMSGAHPRMNSGRPRPLHWMRFASTERSRKSPGGRPA